MIDAILNLSLKDKLVDLFLILILICGLMFIICFFIKKLNVEKISKDGVVFKNTKSERFSETTKNENNYNTNKKSILAHRIFKFMRSTKIEGYFSNIEFSAQSYLKHYFNIMYDELLFYFRELESNDGDDLYKIAEVYINVINKINDKCRLNNISYNSLINLNYENMMIGFISDIIQDESYMDWYSKAFSILDVLYLGFKFMISFHKGDYR